VASETGGVVAEVGVRVGDVVQEGDVLVVLG
jgi:biotin carboxyl carrier protein